MVTDLKNYFNLLEVPGNMNSVTQLKCEMWYRLDNLWQPKSHTQHSALTKKEVAKPKKQETKLS